MIESVCHNCPDRKIPKTCEATCQRRQDEIQRLEEKRNQRYMDNMVTGNKRLDDYVRQEHKCKKQGRR